MICQIEMGHATPTITVLSKIAHAMDIPLGELVDPSRKPQLFNINHLEESKVKTSSDGSHACYLLNEGSSNRHLEIYWFRFNKVGKMCSKGHGGKALEYLFLEKGEMMIHTKGREITIKKGDMIEFDASKEHTYVQKSKQYAEGFSIVFYGL